MKIIEKTYSWSGSLTKRAATKYIVLHHRAGNGDVDSIHQLHLKEGYTGIGYHFYIRKDGSVYRGRPINTMGAHCLGSNANSIGICFEGNYTREEMPTAQIRAGQELIDSIKGVYFNLEVKKHSDLYNTACPGKNFPFKEVTAMPLKKPKDITLDEAITLIQTKAELENETIEFLLCYKYGEDLITKLAKAIRK